MLGYPETDGQVPSRRFDLLIFQTDMGIFHRTSRHQPFEGWPCREHNTINGNDASQDVKVAGYEAD